MNSSLLNSSSGSRALSPIDRSAGSGSRTWSRIITGCRSNDFRGRPHSALALGRPGQQDALGRSATVDLLPGHLVGGEPRPNSAPASSFMMESESLPAFDTVIERKPSAFTTPPRTKLPSGLPGVYQFYSAIFHKRSLHGKTMGDFESAFAAMDLNGDGVLSREEFRRACKDLDLGLSPSQVAELLNHMDKDNSGDIDIHEFIRELKEAISQGGYDPNAIAAEKVKGRLAELGFGFVPPRPASAPEGTGSGARGGARGNRNRQKGRQGSQGSAGAGGAGRRRGRPGSAAAATSSRRQQGGQQQQRKGQQQQQQQQQQRGGSRGRSADSRRRGGDAEDAAAGPAVREISFPESGSTQKPLELRHECQECRGRQMPKLFNCTCGLSVLGHTVYADNEPGECQCFESEKDKKKRLAREKKERQRLEAEKRRKEMQRRMRARQQEEQDKLDAASSRQSLYSMRCNCFNKIQNRWRHQLQHRRDCPFTLITLRPSPSQGANDFPTLGDNTPEETGRADLNASGSLAGSGNGSGRPEVTSLWSLRYPARSRYLRTMAGRTNGRPPRGPWPSAGYGQRPRNSKSPALRVGEAW